MNGLSSTATATPSEALIESRLAAVEAKLGLLSVTQPAGSGQDSVADRLDALKAAYDAQTNAHLREVILESHRLMHDLDPGMALTHQQQPLLYRRQEVLASADTLRNDMDELRKILHLLLTSQQATTGRLREDTVTQAPILTSVSVSHSDERRLDALRLQLDDVHKRSRAMIRKIDHLVETYHSLISAASEKFVLADEALRMKHSD